MTATRRDRVHEVPRSAFLQDIPEVFDTRRLRLEATFAGRGEAVHGAVERSRAELKPWMPWAHDEQTPDETEAYCREMQAKWHARVEFDFCFVEKASGALVGKGGLHTIDWSVPKFEIGYWIATPFTRNGFATEATTGLVEIARGLGARRIEITSDARNAASRRVAEKSGFVLECIRKNSRRGLEGELADSCLFARIF